MTIPEVCNCHKHCPHYDAYRRLPRENGGLGLCENLRKVRKEGKNEYSNKAL